MAAAVVVVAQAIPQLAQAAMVDQDLRSLDTRE
jgi:hypothetical protein